MILFRFTSRIRHVIFHQPTKQRWLRALAVVAFIATATLLPKLSRAETAFLAADEAFTLKVEQPAKPGEPLQLHWAIAPGFYLYRDRMEVIAEPAGTAIAVERPAGEPKEDPNFGAMDVYHHQVTVAVRSAGANSLAVTWQGCAEAGLCYPPQTRRVTLRGAGGEQPAATASQGTADNWTLATSGSDGEIQSMLERLSLAWTIPLFFALGIALAFTPCVLPMIPILSSMVVGSRAGPRRALALSLAFVLPMALTYAGLGAAAAVAGANLQALLQNRWALFGLGGVFVVLAASMFGLFTLQLPGFVRNGLDGASRQQRGGTLVGAAAMGLLSALLVGPCMTAPLAGTLLYIAQSGNAIQGGLLLLALGLGMGMPLLIVGTVGSKYLPTPGMWMDRVKGAFGFLLLATAIWMVQRVVPQSIALAMWGALLVVVAVAVFQTGRSERALSADVGRSRRILAPAVALLMGLWGGAMWLGAAAGGGDPWTPLAFLSASGATRNAESGASAAARFESVDGPQSLALKLQEAHADGKPVLLDFYADWCVSCKSIEKEVFGDPKVVRALEGVVLLRADVTANTGSQLALMREHQVIGPPTVMLFNAQGHERREARLVGEFDSADLLKRAPSLAGVL